MNGLETEYGKKIHNYSKSTLALIARLNNTQEIRNKKRQIVMESKNEEEALPLLIELEKQQNQ